MRNPCIHANMQNCLHGVLGRHTVHERSFFLYSHSHLRTLSLAKMKQAALSLQSKIKIKLINRRMGAALSFFLPCRS
jgi:hypothetical protein